MPGKRKVKHDIGLQIKLHRPALTSDFVHRQRLLDALEKYPNRPLTMIAAPAGYGKSTLAAEWLDRSRLPSAWVSLDESNNDVRSFLTYFCLAVRSIFPDRLEELSKLLAAPNIPPPDALQQLLLNGISKIDKRFILVIDDYQLISEGFIHELISDLILYNIPSIHLVLLTRRDPPMPLHKFRGRGYMTEIRLKDLRFTLEETKEFFRKAGHIDIGKKELTELDARLEGWATGIRLFSHAFSGKEDLADTIKKLEGSYKTITDYLLSEILVRQPDNISELLMATSVMDKFDESLCDYLCSTTDICSGEKGSGSSFISWVRQNNLFTISLDDEGRWFRYHQLFRQLLFSQFEQKRSKDEVSRLQRHAAAYFSKIDLICEAVRLAVAGEDNAMAAGIIIDNRDSMLAEDKWIELELLIDTLPRKDRISSPELLITESWLLFGRMNFPALIDRIGIFEQFLDDPAVEKRLKAEYHFFKGYIEYFMSKGTEALASHKKAVKMGSDLPGLMKGEAELHLVLSTQMVEGGDKALDLANEMIGRKRRIDAKHKGRLWASSAFVNMLEMDLSKAVRCTDKMVAVSKSDPNNFVSAWASYMSSIAHFLWNDNEVALELAEKVIKDRFILAMRTAVDSYCISILSLICRGKSAMAQEQMIELSDYVDHVDEMLITNIADSFKARMAMMEGDLKSAKRWLRTADIEQDRDLMLWWIETPRMTACRILIADAKRDGLERAAGILLDIVNHNKKINNRLQQVMSMPLLAVAMHRLGMADQALETIREAVALAEPAQVVCPFMEFHDDMREMIETIGPDGDGNDFIKLLLDSFIERESISTSDTPVTPRRSVNLQDEFLMEELTNRELVALRLLSRGLYYKEIADEMAVSKDTVKTHLKHVYQKLRAGSRREAVAIAREIGILDQA